MKSWAVFVLLLLSVSCQRVPRANDREVASIVSDRIGSNVHWKQGSFEDEEITQVIHELLAKEVTLDTAVQIALLNNPHIQATFQELGIAHADLIQAGLFRNPLFQGFVRFPNRSGAATNSEVSVTQGFIEVFLIPLRKKIAETDYEKAKFHVSQMLLDVAFDVEEVFYKLQLEVNKYYLQKELVDVLKICHTIAARQFRVGNINELELQSKEQKYLQARVCQLNMQNQIVLLKQEFNRLLGLKPSCVLWKLDTTPCAFSFTHIPSSKLEEIALAKRLDLQQARLESKRLQQMGATKEWWAYTDPAVGISREKDADKTTVLGPTLAFWLPLFDYGQADRMRIEAMLKQSKYREEAIEVDILAEVRTKNDQLMINGRIVQSYEDKILPLQKKILATSQDFYNVMGLSIYKFLQNKQQELEMRIEHFSALQNYLVTKIELDRVVGETVR